MYGIAEGALTEEQFSDSLQVVKTRSYEPGQLADADRQGSIIHRVSNRSSRPLVSLHLYGVQPEHLTTGINRIYG
ncbi:hypothetical protein D3C83_77020 [compost metagenome]